MKQRRHKVTKGKRYNKGKLRWRNFPLFLIEPLIAVGHYGEQKYGETYNFLKGMSMNDSLDSMKRHLNAFEDPYQSDTDESGISHLGHIAWNALVALYMLKHRPDLDDRYKIKRKKK